MGYQMQDNRYITDRWLPKLVQRLCADKGVAVRTFSDDWVLQLDKNEVRRFIYGFKVGGLNDSGAAAVAQDKVATFELLRNAQVPVVPHALISTRASFHADWEQRADSWKRFVIKPTLGAGGRSIYACDTVERANELMAAHYEQSWCLSPFLSIKDETRIILLGNQVLLAFKKHNPVTVHEVPMFNLRLGAVATKVEPSADLIMLADTARRALGLQLAAIDIVTLNTGEQLILEVNEGFSLEHYMRQNIEHEQHVEKVYSAIIDAMMQ